jgi:hypothetical protein
MSTMALVEGPNGIVAAWETEGQIYFAGVHAGTATFTEPQAAPGEGSNRKHPTLALNSAGEMLLAWTEDTGWEKGGALAWQLFDKKGQPRGDMRRIEGGIPVWGLPAVAAGGQGFTIFH